MSFNVLGCYGVELYLDSCVVYGPTEEDFLSNLRKVMDRFEKTQYNTKSNEMQICYVIYRIRGTYNQSKWFSFWTRQIGWSTKLCNVSTLRFATVLFVWSTILGIVSNIWRKNYECQKRLNDISCERRVLQWTQERKDQFERIKSIVKALPQLYFLNDHDPVRVYTDAAEYAVGAMYVK